MSFELLIYCLRQNAERFAQSNLLYVFLEEASCKKHPDKYKYIIGK